MYPSLLVGSLLMCAVLLPVSVQSEESNTGVKKILVKKYVVPVTYFDYHTDGSNPDFGNKITVRTGVRQGDSLTPVKENYRNESGWVDSQLTSDKVPKRNASFTDEYLSESWNIEKLFKPCVNGVKDTFLWKTPTKIETSPKMDSAGNYIYDSLGNTIYDTVKTTYPDTLMISDTMFKNIKVESFDTFTWKPNDITYEDTTDSIWFMGSESKVDPLGSKGFGLENDESTNCGFTYVLRNKFTHHTGDSISIGGDDDCYLFINGKLAIECGGLHSPIMLTCYLDSLKLTVGQKYDMDFFFVERRAGGNFMYRTNIKFETVTKEYSDTITIGVINEYKGKFQKQTLLGMRIPESAKNVRMEYFSISGAKVLDIKKSINNAIANQSLNLPRGMYTVRVTFLNSQGKDLSTVASRKMIVRR
jgi:fibro-slime domain-containing protein